MVAALGLAATPSAAGSPVVTTSSDLVPSVTLDGARVGFVTGGRNALYTGSWTNESHATITNSSIAVTLPAGAVLEAADPDVCTAPAPANPSDPVVVTCLRDNMRSGATFTQQILFAPPGVTAEARFTVMSFLQGKERAHDRNKSHTDTFRAPDRLLTILPTTADAAGACTQLGDDPLGTQSGLSAANPLITAASLSGPTGLFCTPVTLVEQHRSSPTEGCGTGAACTVDIATSEAPPVAAPIQLRFTFQANDQNLTWYKNGSAVADCPGATRLPAGVDTCVNSRSTVGTGAVALGVLWAGGPDPTWTG
jgi:hypothetical protein